MRAKWALLVLLAVLASTGCESAGERAVKEAEARVLEQEAAQAQAEQEAAEARKQADWEGTKAARDASRSAFFLLLYVGMGLFCFAAAFVLLWRLQGLGRSVQRKADLASRMIWVDQKTGAYPVLIVEGAAHVLATGAVIKLGESRDEVPQLMDHSAFTSNLALAGRTAERIAATTKDAQAGDVFGTAAGVLPSTERGSLWREKATVEESRLPKAVKGVVLDRLNDQERKA